MLKILEGFGWYVLISILNILFIGAILFGVGKHFFSEFIQPTYLQCVVLVLVTRIPLGISTMPVWFHNMMKAKLDE